MESKPNFPSLMLNQIIVSVVTIVAVLTAFSFTGISQASAGLDLLRPRPLHRVAVDPRVGGGITYFDKVLEGHRAAESVPLKSASGIYIGRCYYSDHPMKAVASIVVALKADSSAHGPLGSETRLIPLVDRASKPDHYDKLSTKQIRAIRAQASEYADELAIPVESRRETFVVGFRTPDEDARLYRFRRDSNTLFARLDCAEDSVCLSPNNSLGRHTVHAYEGEAIAQCHYFKRIK